ncbi:MAG: glycosyltransferase family 4 protein [Chloroflexota bacterium]|nr:MAG: glycosyltransferase family 4 protein [Chloroflexota bacterium]
MKLLYSLDSFKPNIDGVAVSIERQARAMAARGHQVAIVAPGQRFSNYEEEEGPLRVYRRRSLSLLLERWRLSILPDANKVLDDFRPDLLIGTLPFPLGWALLLAARRRGIPTVGISETMPEWLVYNLSFLRPAASQFIPWMWRLIVGYYNRFDYIVGVTPTALRLLRDNGLTRPAQVISNGVELDVFHPRPLDRDLARRLNVPDRPVVLYAGRLDAEKCMDVWLRAAALMADQVDVHYVVVGDGSERARLERQADEMGLSGRITFTGFLEREDYVRAFSLGQVFAIASPAELQSLVTLEAAASGLPIVAANAGALPELVEDGRDGFLFDVGSAAQMAARTLRILRDPALHNLMRCRSREIAERHDINRVFAKYEALFILAAQRGPLPLDDLLREPKSA